MQLLKFCLTFLVLLATSRTALCGIRAGDFEVAPPPASGSHRAREDLRTVLRFQETRTQRDCSRGDLYHHRNYNFDAMYGDLLTELQYREVKPLMIDVFALADGIIEKFKSRYRRPYPFEAFSEVQPCVSTGLGSGSYPSGHAANGIVMACVLAEIFPRKAEKLLERGEFHGDIRVVIGRHFPSDVEAGKKLGREICRAILEDKDFGSAIEAIKSGR